MIYADPGSGILIWQLLLGLFFGATFFFTKVRHWVVSKLRPQRDNEGLRAGIEDANSKSSARRE